MSEDTERRSTQAYAILPLRKSKTYRTRNGQDAQQEEKAQDGRSQHGKRRCHIMAQEKNSLSLFTIYINHGIVDDSCCIFIIFTFVQEFLRYLR